MEQIWAPWRIAYIQRDKPTGCFLCEKPKQKDDEANQILYCGEKNFVMLNAYPYNPGQLLIAPYRHVATLEELTREELHEHFEIVSRSVKILKKALKPEGFNVGINLGKAAGAGIDDHVHTHIVPRWNGDTNFMPIIANAKVLSEALTDTYKKLKGKF